MGWVWGWGRGSVLYSLGNDSCPAVHKKHTPTLPHTWKNRPTDGTITKRNGLWEWGDSKFGCANSLTRYLFHQLCWGSTRMRRNLNKLASDKCNTLTWHASPISCFYFLILLPNATPPKAALVLWNTFGCTVISHYNSGLYVMILLIGWSKSLVIWACPLVVAYKLHLWNLWCTLSGQSPSHLDAQAVVESVQNAHKSFLGLCSIKIMQGNGSISISISLFLLIWNVLDNKKTRRAWLL